MSAQKFRKKPVVIEAMRLNAYTELLPPADWNDNKGGEIWRWLRSHDTAILCKQEDPGPAYGIIPTLEGDMRADIGDWIIRGVKGEFYPCKPDIFDATYERVERSDDTSEPLTPSEIAALDASVALLDVDSECYQSWRPSDDTSEER